MIALPGYRILETLDDGALHMIVRALDESSGESVIIKTVQETTASASIENRLRREYKISQHVNSNRIVPVRKLIEHRNAPFLIKQDVGGESLGNCLKKDRLSMPSVLSIGTAVASSLQAIHTSGVIHKDVKPDNVIVSEDLSTAWLTDFDISSQLKKERASEADLNELGGSLPYISPEQTGRMNRSIDTRSDLYSLGITLFEMATGERPFESADALEVVHSHIARQPADPIVLNPEVPPALKAIILRLLAKTAEHRYQSAAGVVADLRRCADLLTNGESSTFELGVADIPLVLRVPEKLYGREKETQTLLDLYDQVSDGQMKVVAVRGYSGIGKSSLVSELNKPVTRDRGRFQVGKFDQYKRSVPYSAIVQALDGVGRRMLAGKEEESREWKLRLLESVDVYAGILTDLIPSFSVLLGSQGAAQEMTGVDAQNRQNRVLAQAIAATAQPSTPLVMFVDDVQWADSWTLSLLDHLAANPIPHLMLILAYRDNETPDGHPLLATLQRFEQAGVKITDLHLNSLSEQDTRKLVADTLHGVDRSTDQLADVVHHKTNGNPFFINEFLTKLFDDGLLAIDASSGVWIWDVTLLASHAVTDNVVDLMSQKLRLLAPDQQRALAIAAVVGSTFDLPVLSHVMGSSRLAAESLLTPAIDGLIRIEGAQSLDTALLAPGETATDLTGMVGRFAHDRIRQAAFELLTDSERPPIHEQVARAYVLAFSEQELDEHLFDLASHFIASADHHRPAQEVADMIKLLVKAGDKAMATSAFVAARKYFEAAVSASGPNAWDTDPEKATSIALNVADAMWSNSDLQDLEACLDDLESRDLETIARVQVVAMRRRIAFARAQVVQAVEYGRQGMELLGVTFPRKPNKLHAGIELLRVGMMTRGKKPEYFASLPPSNNIKALLIIEIIAEISEAVYYADPDLFPLVLLKQVELTLKFGNHANSASVYTGYGIIRVIALNDVDWAYDLCGMALNLPEVYNARQWRPKNELSYAYLVQQRKEHISQTYKHFQFAYRLGLETGMHSDVANATIGMSFHGMLQGKDVAQLESDANSYLATLRTIKQQRNIMSQGLYKTAFVALQDPEMRPTFDRGEFSPDEYIRVCREAGDFTSLGSVGVASAYVYLVFEEFDAAKRALKFSLPFAKFTQGLIFDVWTPFVHALVESRSADPQVSSQRRSATKILKKALKTISKWAKDCPANYHHMALLLEAEIFRMSGKTSDAEAKYKQAIAEAATSGFVNCEALAADCAIAFYRALGRTTEMNEAMSIALESYRRWGVVGRVNALEQALGRTSGSDKRASTQTTHTRTSTTTSSGAIGAGLDLGTVMKASHVIAAEIDRERLLSTTMQIMLENAGADRGVLLISRRNAWVVATETVVDHESQVDPGSAPSDRVPMQVVSYVERTRETVVCDDASMDDRFNTDPFVVASAPRSILSLPILHQSKLIGVLYLENSLLREAFTPDRIAVLRLLTSQLAISLENAELYQSLEHKVAERTLELQQTNALLETERERSERLLMNMLPPEIAHRLKQGETNIADHAPEVSVMFADIVNFTELSAARSPEDVVEILNAIFNMFDDEVADLGLEKIKTIGDAYMVVSGLPSAREDHASAIATLAVRMQQHLPRLQSELGLDHLGLRVGIHSGPVVAGVIGRSKYSYDLWGDTVNVASRMESHGAEGAIHVSQDFVDALHTPGHEWKIEQRGDIEVKGKGSLRTYWLLWK